jgi:hypothetical protein
VDAPFFHGTSVFLCMETGGNPDRNHKFRNINREIYTPYADAAGILLQINGKFTMGKLKSSFLS